MYVYMIGLVIVMYYLVLLDNINLTYKERHNIYAINKEKEGGVYVEIKSI